MGLFSRLFGKKTKDNSNIRKRKNEPDVINVQTEDEKMNWAIDKANLTLHHFKKCLKAPNPSQQYFSIKVRIEDNHKNEHIWLTEPSFDAEGNLFGVIGNEPIDVTNVSMGQKIGVDNDRISDWMIIENGRLIGGYTIRVLRENYKGRDLKNFDRSLGGMVIDDGEDYFLPDNSTPEGAIVLLEKAYNEDNLEKAISCKDFKIEAEMMLSKFGKENLTEEIINKTTEALKLAFIKSHQENGLPKFDGIKQAFPKREKINDKHMIITEVCYYPNNTKSSQKMNVFKSEDGWKVLSPAN